MNGKGVFSSLEAGRGKSNVIHEQLIVTNTYFLIVLFKESGSIVHAALASNVFLCPCSPNPVNTTPCHITEKDCSLIIPNPFGGHLKKSSN